MERDEGGGGTPDEVEYVVGEGGAAVRCGDGGEGEDLRCVSKAGGVKGRRGGVL